MSVELVVAPPKKAKKAAKKKVYDCTTCKLTGPKIADHGNLEEAEVLIVVDPPTSVEIKYNKPLAGRAFRLMANSLNRTGFDLNKCYFTSALLCQLPPRKDPTPTQIKSCGVTILDKISKMPNLKMVITCGKWPLKFFLNKSTPRAVRGELFTKNDINIFPIYDPYYILDNIQEREVMEVDLTRAKQIIDKGIKKKNIKYTLCKTLNDLRETKAILLKAKKISFDIESRGGEYGLDLFTDKNFITTIAFTNEKLENFCIPVDHPESPLLKHRDEVVATIKEIMESPIKKIAHNFRFDAKGLRTFLDVYVNNFYFDTALANSVLNKGNGDSNKLKRLAIEYLGYVNDYGIIKDDAPLDEEPLENVAEYNSEDTENTMLLYEIFKPRLKEEELDVYFSDLVMKGCEGLTDTELNGIKIDVAYGKDLSDKYTKRCVELESKLRSYPEVQALTAAADEPFNLESPKQLATLLFDKFKLPVIKTTKTGRSTDVDTMKALEDKHPFIPDLQMFKKSTKLVSTYIVNLTDKHLKDDGKIHCSFNQDVTRTGRLSSSQPNMQNQPSKGEIGKDLKKIFISSFKGGSLIQADYSQIELRVAAIVANEKTMLDIYANDGDIHRSMAAFITGKAEEDVTAEERGNAKPVNFGFCLTPDTTIITKDGYKNITDVTVGDIVLTHKNNWKKVLETQKIKTTEIIKIKTRTNKEIKCTADHMMLVQFPSANGRPAKKGFVRADELTTTDYLVYHNQTLPFSNDLNISTDEAKIIGWFISEGSYNGNGIRIKQCPKASPDVFSLMYEVCLRYGMTNNNDYFYTHITKIKEFFNKVDIDYTLKSKDKKLSDKIKNSDYNTKRHILGSLWDGDGCITGKLAVDGATLKKCNIFYTSLSRELLLDVQYILDTLGINSKIYKYDSSPCGTVHIVGSAGRERFLSIIPTIKIDRHVYKPKKQFQAEEKISSIEKVSFDNYVYDFTVEDDHSFVANGLFTHNCYGQSPKGFVVSAKRDYGVDFTLAEATRIRERYFKMYPALLSWYERTWAFARKTSYVKTLFGRKRTIFNLHSDNNFLRNKAENQSINTEIQGTAGEMCILAIYHINKFLKEKGMRSMIVNTVHDSIILDCPKEEVMQTAKIVKTIMENVPTPFDKPIPMKADIEIGPSWGELKEVTI